MRRKVGQGGDAEVGLSWGKLVCGVQDVSDLLLISFFRRLARAHGLCDREPCERLDERQLLLATACCCMFAQPL